MANKPTYIRVPESQDPNRVYKIGPEGGPIADPEALVKETGARTAEEAFQQVETVSSEEARSLGVRLPGTERLFASQAETLTPEMLEEVARERKVATAGELEAGDELPPIDTARPSGSADLRFDEGVTAQMSQLDKKIFELEQKRQEAAEAQAKAAETKVKEGKEELEKMGEEDVYSTAYEKLKEQEELEKEQQELRDIQAKIAKREAMYRQELNLAAGRLEPMGFVRGEEAQMKRQYQADITSLQAQAEIEQGDVALAQQRIETALNLMKQDRQERLGILETMLSLNQQDLLRFEKDEKEALDAQIKMLSQEQDDIEANLKEKWDYATASAQAGYNIKDVQGKSLDQVREEANANLARAAQEGDTTGYRNFTSQEKRKLESTGIDWTAPGGYERALDYLYGEGAGETLSVMDVKRYKDLYPNAGIEAGDTEADANFKVYLTTLPAQIEAYKNDGYSKEDVEELFKKENGTIFPEEQKIIDDVYEAPTGLGKVWSEIWHRLPFVK